MIIVEDGTGIVGADSYVSVSEADAYHSAYGNTDWEQVTDKELLLRKASRDVDVIYGGRFGSSLLTITQTLLWPRKAYYNTLGYNITGVPTHLKWAVCELALLLKDGDVLVPDDNSGNIKSETKKVGDLEKSVEHFGASSVMTNKLRRVTALMNPILLGRSSAMYARVIRG